MDARAALDIAGWKKVVDCKARQEGKALLTKNWPSRCVGMNNFNLNLPKPDEHQKMIHEASNRDVVLVDLQYDVYDSLFLASFLLQ